MLENKVALVTGASRGIGAAIARALAGAGAEVAVNYATSPDHAAKVVDGITEAGGRAMAVQADVTDPEAVQAMIAAVAVELGPVDILVNNASISFPMVPFLDCRWEDFAAKLNGEARAGFFTCQAVAPSMIERGGGSIVNVSSTLSRAPAPGFVAHSGAKSALDAFSKSLAQELGPVGVRVNVVAPGFTETDATSGMPAETVEMIKTHTPLQRVGQPEDVAGAVLFLCSDAARHITGAYVPVCGGAYLA